MATCNKFDSFVTACHAGTHAGAINASTDELDVYLSNTAPSASGDSVKADLAEITNENGYAAPRDTQNSASQTGGTITVVATDITITASGGTVGPFQYVVLFNQTVAGDPLWCWWVYPGGPITLQDGESILINFGANLFQFS